MANEDLREYVDNPQETLQIELKRWLDLRDQTVRAKIARHICALSNHGGGYLIFGFNDDRTVDTSGVNFADYITDTFSSIAKKYLSPPVQCVAHEVSSSTGNRHVVVMVPALGTTPVCAVASGPHDTKGQPQGIVTGTHYHRETGPNSTPVNTAEAWRPIIHRCVVNEREALLGSIAAIMRGGALAFGTLPNWGVPRSTPTTRLRAWHDAGRARFLEIVASAGVLNWPVSIQKNYYQFSYLLDPATRKTLPDFIEALRTANLELRDTVWSGWSMFYPFTRPEIAPYIEIVNLDDTEIEVVEANLFKDVHGPDTVPEFWRVSRDGMATIIRPYREDRPALHMPDRGLIPGTWLSPYIQARELAEVLRHARALAKLFPEADSVDFRATWSGLANRHLPDDLERGPSDRYVSHSDGRTIEGQWPLSDVASNWPEIVATTASDVTRLFGLEVSADWVVRKSEAFRRL